MTIKSKVIELIGNEHYNILINQRRDLRYEIKKLKNKIKTRDNENQRLRDINSQFLRNGIELQNEIVFLKKRIQELELEHEMI